MRRIRELAKLAGDEEGGLLSDVDGVIADPLEAARDHDHPQAPLAEIGVAAEAEHVLHHTPVPSIDQLVRRTVDVFVRKVRDTIDALGPRHGYVQTRYGVGYKLEAVPK